MLTQEELKNILDYNQDTGVFIWKRDVANQVKSGDVAGCVSSKHGYIRILIKRKEYSGHRLAWLYIHGYLPKGKQIDHINHNKTDNRIINLRLVTHSENQQNRTLNINNTSGVSGVNWNKARHKWVASIKVESKYIYLGGFEVFSDAVNARKNAEVLYGFHENHGKEL